MVPYGWTSVVRARESGCLQPRPLTRSSSSSYETARTAALRAETSDTAVQSLSCWIDHLQIATSSTLAASSLFGRRRAHRRAHRPRRILEAPSCRSELRGFPTGNLQGIELPIGTRCSPAGSDLTGQSEAMQQGRFPVEGAYVALVVAAPIATYWLVGDLSEPFATTGPARRGEPGHVRSRRRAVFAGGGGDGLLPRSWPARRRPERATTPRPTAVS